MPTKVRQIGRKPAGENEVFDTFVIVLEIDGIRRRYEGPAENSVGAIRDAYFFWTGWSVDLQERLWGGVDLVFTTVPAEPDDFRHLEGVPFFLHAPF